MPFNKIIRRHLILLNILYKSIILVEQQGIFILFYLINLARILIICVKIRIKLIYLFQYLFVNQALFNVNFKFQNPLKLMNTNLKFFNFY